MSERLTGVVSKFKGKFGFITGPDGEKVFFPGGAIPKGVKLSENDEVSFVMEEIPEDERRKPDQMWRATEIELVNVPAEEEAGKTNSKKSDAKEQPKKFSNWEFTPLDEVFEQYVRVHGNEYRFLLKAGKEPTPLLLAKTSVPMTFFDAASGEEIPRDDSGILAMTRSELTLKVKMGLALRGELNFKSPGMDDKVFILEFK